MNHRRTVYVTTVGILSALVMTVQCQKRLPHGVLAQEEIKADKGGRVETSDGKLVIDIPPNALSANATVTVTAVDSPPAYPAFDFIAPYGTCYNIEVGNVSILDSITIRVDAAAVPDVAITSLAYFDTSFACWALTGGVLDSSSGCVSLKTTHLSDWWTFYFTPPTISKKVLSVPYYSQRGLQWCAPTSMAMVMKYNGFDHEYHEAAAAMQLAPDEGPDLFEVIRSKMLPAYRAMTGVTPYRFLLLDNSGLLLVPVILGNLVQANAASALSSWEGRHVVAVTGWSKDSIWYHDPSGAYDHGQIQARCSWPEFFSIICGASPNFAIVDAFDLQAAPEENREGTVEAYTGSFDPNGASKLWWDGKTHPCGYYWIDDGTGRFPDDPNEDGLNLEHMARPTDTMLLECLHFNNTPDSRAYHITTKLCDRSSGTILETIRDTTVVLAGLASQYVKLLTNDDPYFPTNLTPGRYSFRVYLACDGITQDSFNVHFNLADGGNNAPNAPGAPDGPMAGQVGVSYEFTASTTDPEQDQIQYQFDWGDGRQSDWSSLVPSGQQVQMSYVWPTVGTYSVKARAKDEHGTNSGWSAEHQIIVSDGGGNNPPNTPSAPSGPDSGQVGVSYQFTDSSTDPDGDSVALRFSWGDGDTSAWSSFVASGNPVRMSKAWSAAGTYSIRAQAKDSFGALSGWSSAHQVQISTGGGQGSLKWRFATGGMVRSSPAIGSDGTIYFGSSDGNLYAAYPSGAERWHFLSYAGAYASDPAVGGDGTIYVADRNSDSGCLYAINPDGSERWRFPHGGKNQHSLAVGADGTIYLGSSNDSLYAINPDGSERWHSPVNDFCSLQQPAIGNDGTIYVASDYSLYAIRPDGSERWHIQYSSYGSPLAIGSDGTIYQGQGSNLCALYPDGSERWHFKAGDIIQSSPAIGSDGTIYFGCNDDNLYAVYPGGTERWRFPAGGNVICSPTVGSDGTIYIGPAGNNLYAVNPDGTERWQFPSVSGKWSSPTIGSDGTIYVGSDDNNLYAVYGTGILADTPWPKLSHDISNTSRVGGGAFFH